MQVTIDGISFEEIEIFSLVYRENSVREAARRRHQSPSHISKHLKSLEDKLQTKLFVRTQQNLIPTIEAVRFFETAKVLVEKLRAGIRDIHSPRAEIERKIISIGTISFLASHLIPGIIPKLNAFANGTDLRIVEFTHNKLVNHGILGAFGAAIHIGKLDWPKSWDTKSIGHLRWSLFASSKLKTTPKLTNEDVRKFKFIVPVDWKGSDYSVGDDFCPLNVHQRLMGHEAFTAEAAIQLISMCDQVAYVPDIIAERALALKQIRRLDVVDWPETKQELFLSVHRDAMTKRHFDHLRSGFADLVSAKGL